MATYWENSCSFGLRNVFLVSVPGCWFGFSHIGFWSGNLFLIASFPDLCLLVPSNMIRMDKKDIKTSQRHGIARIIFGPNIIFLI